MPTIDDNVGRSQRLAPSRPLAGGSTPPTNTPTATPGPKPELQSDERAITNRPQTEQERQQEILKAVQAAQGTTPAATPGDQTPETQSDTTNTPPAIKNVADGIGIADGVREGVRISSSVDELKALPLVGKMVQNEGRVGKFLSFLARSHVGSWLSGAMQTHRFIAPVMRGLGRIAPFAGIAVAGFDLYGMTKTLQDPKAGGLEKGLAVTKGVFSAISGVAGMAALFLAPTGIGAAIAGGIALGAGLLSTGADLWLGHVQKVRKQAQAQPQPQPAAAK